VPSISTRWEGRAFKELAALPKDARQRLVTATESLTSKPLKGEQLSGEWHGLRRLRVGRYRLIYANDGARLIILVVRAGQRREACPVT
jgi:mRNA interferase RelE/StbE